MAICIVERWKKSMGYRFVFPEYNHAQKSHAQWRIQTSDKGEPVIQTLR